MSLESQHKSSNTTLIGLLRDLPSVKEHWRALDLTPGSFLYFVCLLRGQEKSGVSREV
jgi:hypothetical protein